MLHGTTFLVKTRGSKGSPPDLSVTNFRCHEWPAQWAEIMGQEDIDYFPEFLVKLKQKIHFRYMMQ